MKTKLKQQRTRKFNDLTNSLLSLFQFKKINHAHSILSDEKKRSIYDKHGSFGLYVADQFGDDVVEHLMLFSSKWFQVRFYHFRSKGMGFGVK